MMVVRTVAVLLLTLAGLIPAAVHAGGGPAQCSPFSPALQARLSTTLDQQMRRLNLPGVVVNVTVPGKGCWSAARGLADQKTRTPMQLDDHLRIGSITKSMTLTVILMLMDRGRLSLDDPISRYVSGVPNGNTITLRELGDMRSGLFDYTTDPALLQAVFSHPHRSWSPEQVLAYAWRHPPYFAPNQGFHYSSTNIILLGLVIRKLTGRPVPEVFSQWLFKPLGMTQTFLATNGRLPSPYAHGYTDAPGPVDSTHWNPSWGWTAGAVVTTLHDLVIWTGGIGHGALLSPQAQRERLAGVPIEGYPGAAYGLGVNISHGWISHDGDIPGYFAWTGYYVPLGATVSVMMNTDIPYRNRGLGELIAALIGVVIPGSLP